MQRDELGTTCRVCCIGAAGVGKSALTTMLTIRRFSEAYDPTVEEELRQECVLRRPPFDLCGVLDSDGSLTRLWCAGSWLMGSWLR
jgi:polynucleotide 5'-kinase involved in rRNA processing